MSEESKELIDYSIGEIEEAIIETTSDFAAGLHVLFRSWKLREKGRDDLLTQNVTLRQQTIDLTKTVIDHETSFKQIFILLNAERDIALTIPGVEDLLTELGKHMLSSSSIKAGVMNEAGK